MNYNDLYIGHYNLASSTNILLCVSTEKDAVKDYLKNVRKLNKEDYSINIITLDEKSAYALYEKYMLLPFMDICYLTNRDIDTLLDEKERFIRLTERIIDDLTLHYNTLAFDKRMHALLDTTQSTIQALSKQIYMDKKSGEISHVIIAQSIVFSSNISEYLKRMGYIEEEKEYTEMFYRKLQEE